MSENGQKVIEIPESLTVRELAASIEVSPIDVIKRLMASGVMANINQQIDFDTAAIVAAEMGYEAVLESQDETGEEDFGEIPLWRQLISDEPSDQLITRPPVVTVLGHVDHGKTTLVQALTGVWASRHSEELKRGITLRLGYADMAIYKCPKCEPPKNYSIKPICPNCASKAVFDRAISFGDAPGHEALMATMLSVAAIMDGAILVIAADEPCPQPQTREHLAAAQVIGIKNIIIVQNKIDIVEEKRALKSYEEIKNFVKGTIAENAPIIPVSAQHGINMDVLLNAIEEIISTPKRDETKPPLMNIIRSFDVNRPGTSIEDLEGGIIGGTITQGKFTVGDKIEIRPGISVEREGKTVYTPLISEIVSLHAGERKVKEAT